MPDASVTNHHGSITARRLQPLASSEWNQNPPNPTPCVGSSADPGGDSGPPADDGARKYPTSSSSPAYRPTFHLPYGSSWSGGHLRTSYQASLPFPTTSVAPPRAECCRKYVSTSQWLRTQNTIAVTHRTSEKATSELKRIRPSRAAMAARIVPHPQRTRPCF